jgi:hypothetical protein
MPSRGQEKRKISSPPNQNKNTLFYTDPLPSLHIHLPVQFLLCPRHRTASHLVTPRSHTPHPLYNNTRPEHRGESVQCVTRRPLPFPPTPPPFPRKVKVLVAATMAILPELATEVLIPVAGVIGIVFAIVQWVVVSRVKLTPAAASSGGGKDGGYGDYLIEEEEGLNDHNVVVKCAEIQNAIAEGEDVRFASDLGVSRGSFKSAHFVAALSENRRFCFRF